MSGSPESRGLTDLPNELIHEVAACTELGDLLTLCRTSRFIHAHCLPRIYRSITLKDVAQVSKWCQTILLRTTAAQSVHNLIISCSPSDPSTNFYTMMHSAIRRLENLQSLTVSKSRTIFHTFSDLHFPRLSNVIAPSSYDIFPFLTRHPMLCRVLVMPSADDNGTWWENPGITFPLTPSERQIQMPDLQVFAGPLTVARAVVPGSLVSILIIYWEKERTTSFSDDVAMLAQSNSDILDLQNLIFGWIRNQSLLRAIADHIPRVKRLRLRNLLDLHTLTEWIMFLEYVEDTLSSFPCLTHLDLLDKSCPPLDGDDYEVFVFSVLDDDFRTIRRWAAICPTLLRVRLPRTRTIWEFRNGIWFPHLTAAVLTASCRYAMQRTTLLHFKWFFTTLISMAPSLPKAYHSFAEYLAGKQGLLAARDALDIYGSLPDFEFIMEPEHGNDREKSRILFQPPRLDSDSDMNSDTYSDSD
ncbi:hypothetical protein GGX14DRAFT_463593 [Mycena pura]|uniref:F-box domain-containing protein n=1 Tax=Mycena pura TaxID=153505 RepID=A0AAD6V4C4_9AGAR|nr:hypothetical protein GGX14DRAFT_463593 [Mycena pura]